VGLNRQAGGSGESAGCWGASRRFGFCQSASTKLLGPLPDFVPKKPWRAKPETEMQWTSPSSGVNQLWFSESNRVTLVYLSKWIPSSISTCVTTVYSLVVHFSNRKHIPVVLMKCSFFLILFIFVLMKMCKMRESQPTTCIPRTSSRQMFISLRPVL